MRGLKRRILAVIEEVNHEIRVDLGLEEPIPELKTIDTLGIAKELPKIKQADDEEESEEAKAFERILNQISERYERERAEIRAESEEEILDVQLIQS
ncbi:hypothetical protein [Dysgonomonas sp. 520]|uniref:hypothetical protein n=1 Tax=Dysgonomonas sp. 520 TaxID=2302931 RepID=UPI0013D03481|nr:hypothetical protein [Dysgonomonas sp. 520]NDW08658.1 hypothetical protein [Dysgonomonas sp. 520]